MLKSSLFPGNLTLPDPVLPQQFFGSSEHQRVKAFSIDLQQENLALRAADRPILMTEEPLQKLGEQEF